MGKVLDSLRRRDGNGPHATEKPELPLPSHPPSTAPEPAESDWAEGSIPFIEVPEWPKPNTTVAALPAVAAPTVTALPVAFQPVAPPLPEPLTSVAPALCVWSQPDSPAACQYRQVRDTLVYQLKADKIHSLLLVPVGRTADLTAAALNLALALAEERRRVVFIETDGRGRAAVSLLGLAPAPGWTEVLAGMPLDHVVQDSGWYQLHIIAAGNRLARTGLAHLTDRTRRVLGQLSDRYDWVLGLAAPWHTGEMLPLLAHFCDASCLLLAQEPNADALLTESLKVLHRDQVPVLGSILASP